MGVMICPFQHLSPTQRKAIFSTFFTTTHAYAVMHSLYGYSLSELEAELTTTNNTQHHAVVENTTQNSIGVIRIEEQNAHTVTLMIDSLPGIRFETLNAIASHIHTFKHRTPHLKLYSYVMPHESHNTNILRHLGLVYEATLEDHLFIDGHYHALEIWGSLRS